MTEVKAPTDNASISLATGLSTAAIIQRKNVLSNGTPQIKTIYKHLTSPKGLDKGLSDMEARMVYRINALPRRISDLEAEYGVTVERLRKKDPTGRAYVRYYLVLPKDGDTGEAA